MLGGSRQQTRRARLQGPRTAMRRLHRPRRPRLRAAKGRGNCGLLFCSVRHTLCMRCASLQCAPHLLSLLVSMVYSRVSVILIFVSTSWRRCARTLGGSRGVERTPGIDVSMQVGCHASGSLVQRSVSRAGHARLAFHSAVPARGGPVRACTGRVRRRSARLASRRAGLPCPSKGEFHRLPARARALMLRLCRTPWIRNT